MMKNENNYAFIDSQNLNLSIQGIGWKLDFARFRVYLKDKYSVNKAFLFIGYIEGNNQLYKSLQEAGYICIFKPTLTYKDGSTKGNVDAFKIVKVFKEYMNAEGHVIKGDDYMKNIEAKMKHPGFVGDVTPLLPAEVDYDAKSAFSLISQKIVPPMDSM